VLVSAAVLPHPPMLVPEVAAGAAHELASLREACSRALEMLLEAHPDLVVVVGSSDGPRRYFADGAAGSFAGFGVPLRVRLPGPGAQPDTTEPTLPASLAVAAWLMEQHQGWPVVRAEAVPVDLSPDEAAELGGRWAEQASRVAIVAMGDGSAALSPKAPGYLVPGAADWQQGVTQAIGSADLDTLAKLDPADGARYVAAGRPAWQVLAGAARGGSWSSVLLADQAPYGVAYLVAAWSIESR
jgi:hypothetical protein